MAEARAEYGDTYVKENAEKFYKSTIYHKDLIDIKPGQKNCYEINNNVLEDNTAIKELNKILGLEDVEVNAEEIAKVNYERFQKMKEAMAMHAAGEKKE